MTFTIINLQIEFALENKPATSHNPNALSAIAGDEQIATATRTLPRRKVERFSITAVILADERHSGPKASRRPERCEQRVRGAGDWVLVDAEPRREIARVERVRRLRWTRRSRRRRICRRVGFTRRRSWGGPSRAGGGLAAREDHRAEEGAVVRREHRARVERETFQLSAREPVYETQQQLPNARRDANLHHRWLGLERLQVLVERARWCTVSCKYYCKYEYSNRNCAEHLTICESTFRWTGALYLLVLLNMLRTWNMMTLISNITYFYINALNNHYASKSLINKNNLKRSAAFDILLSKSLYKKRSVDCTLRLGLVHETLSS